MAKHTNRQPDNVDHLIQIRGATQNNLKNIDLDIRQGEFTVVTGPSGSGKSSLVFDTLYAEGQRRYVETFSPYARQFLDRMDRPHVESISGIPPAIAIDQNGVVRTSRSTVGTMTELNDHIKLLFAHNAHLFCPSCGQEVTEYTPQSIFAKLTQELKDYPESTRVYITFDVFAPDSLPLETVEAGLSSQGFSKILSVTATQGGKNLCVVADRFKANKLERTRTIDAIEQALSKGSGTLKVFIDNSEGEHLLSSFREGFVCAHCDKVYRKPYPSLFSFNSPLGACETCKGFGRVISVDPNLVIPDPTKTLAEGAVKPWTTATFKEVRDDLARCAAKRGISLDVPYEDLSEEDKKWLWNGDEDWSGKWNVQWYGIHHFFEWLESKAYKMHVRVLLSRYRSYTPCPTCQGSHLKQEALHWRYGTLEDRHTVLGTLKKDLISFKPRDMTLSDVVYQNLPGFNFHELANIPIAQLSAFFQAQLPRAQTDEEIVLKEIIARLGFLNDVGLGYLTLDRQSRTLSGGEVQRVNLTTALGTSLVNTLFLLDEPSIGLHPRDMDRVNRVMKRLTSTGNTLVVVEHDPQVMLAADRLIDLGPGAGRQGGYITYDGPTRAVLNAPTSTGLYLSGKKRIRRPHPTPVTTTSMRLNLEKIQKHNLNELSVSIPLKHFVAIAGVSGAGKSTLLGDVLVPVLQQHGRQLGTLCKSVSGKIPNDVIFVDQSAIGRTSRGNPASYVGSFDGIRRLFAASPEAHIAGLKYGDFSFNSGNGRCPTCGGSGSEHIEMQFLSDVYLPCPECHGSRYKESTLRVRIPLQDDKSYNIAEILELTVDQATDLFKAYPNVTQGLQQLINVGLGYLTLGQPLNTLSGGERQRLKLAGYLAEGLTHNLHGTGKLFVFDEPTTGLHFSDIEKLVKIFDTLVGLGHSVIVIEHNLDILSVADWVIELGPEGGDNGGQIVFEGTPDDLARASTHTGKALFAWRQTLDGIDKANFFNFPSTRHDLTSPANAIVVKGAREHNLHNLSVSIPRDTFTVITGPSGSGKSTLAFDIIFAEGQRRYLESLNAYARSMVQPPPLPDVDSVKGIPPSVAIEQRTSRGGLRSTVSTMTEIYHFLRLLYVKLGTQYCPDCHVPTRPQSRQSILDDIMERFGQESVEILAPIVRNQKGVFRAEIEQFRQQGFIRLRIDQKYVNLNEETPTFKRYVDHCIDLPLGKCQPQKQPELLKELVDNALAYGKGLLLVAPIESGTTTSDQETVYSTESCCPHCMRSFPTLDPRLFSYNASIGACATCSGYGILTEAIAKAKKSDTNFIDELKDDDSSNTDTTQVCPDCHGQRLNPVALSVLWHDMSIADIGKMSINEALAFFSALQLDERETAIGSEALKEILSRLHFLQNVGLGYLNLDRSAPTLSGGEAQRIRLASQLGSNLQGVCYVLDEPTIGLHPRDNQVLLNTIESLTKKGNTLLVVEHDEDTIRRADHIIDIGPGAGSEGGQLVAEGTLKDIEANPSSITGQYLKHPLVHTGIPTHRHTDSENEKLVIHNPQLHNLKIRELALPLGKLIAVTGVSGSGKSTLIREVLYPNLKRALDSKKGDTPSWVHCEKIEGWELLDRILEVDQTPIGKTPRSCPATYIGFYDHIRALFATLPESQARGYTASRYSFNNKGGRCEECGGQGYKTVEMNFLPDVKVECEVCHGARFNPETLAIQWKNYDIGEILQLSVDDACSLFASHPRIARPLQLMSDVGLGYLKLGQPSPTLSGGEAQRIKLITELAKAKPNLGSKHSTQQSVYILDEPTVGLHMNDVAKLINVIKQLVDSGNTVIVIEHNLDVIAEADWVIDMGPEAGQHGGEVIAQGTPFDLSKTSTYTGVALRDFLKTHQG